ncbi:g1252 [Coccomyxa viridis]|uniref:G1252 protein n=1 Tax=Coccomyxa viridis TaxID=1274662 RepID=A0ABP1FHK4_9CHLO
MLMTARVEGIDSMEAYFSGILQPTGCISERNEGAAISLILQRGGINDDIKAELASHAQQLSENVFSGYTRCPEGSIGSDGGTCSPDEGALLRWAEKRHIESRIEPKSFGGMRGAAATELLEAGASAVSVPEQCLIHEGTAAASDIGKALTALGIDGELLLILYSMIDRRDQDSDFAPFWQSMPKTLATGLSMTREDLEILEGTPAADAIRAAQQHVRGYFEAALPALSALTEAFPDDILPEYVSEEAFLWAAQLWYSYGMEVKFPDGQVRQCLVPVACLMNHSPWPHVIRYGQIDPGSRLLNFPVFRVCKSGEQCHLSYGPLPNLKLLLFYGFTLPHNPSDVVSISFELPDDANQHMRERLLLEHQLNLHTHYLGHGGLAPSLLAALRLAVGDSQYLNQVAQNTATAFQEGTPELEETVRVALRLADIAGMAQLRKLRHWLGAGQKLPTCPMMCIQALGLRSRRERGASVAVHVSTEANLGLMQSEEEFNEAVSQSKIVVVDWMAKWCRKCIYLKPKLQKLFQEEFPGVPLVFIDVNAVPGSLVTGNGIRKMPTIAVYKEGKKISEHVAQETGTGSFQKVREIVQLALL